VQQALEEGRDSHARHPALRSALRRTRYRARCRTTRHVHAVPRSSSFCLLIALRDQSGQLGREQRRSFAIMRVSRTAGLLQPRGERAVLARPHGVEYTRAAHLFQSLHQQARHRRRTLQLARAAAAARGHVTRASRTGTAHGRGAQAQRAGAARRRSVRARRSGTASERSVRA